MFRMAARLVDSSDKAKRRYDTAARAGVVASSQYLLNEIKKAYNDYYTTGDFRSTLQIRQAWRRADPEKNNNGWYTIVGVPSETITAKGSQTAVDRGKVALYWEMGHDNLYTGKRERVPIAVPTATASAKGMADAWARVVKRYMEAP